jgi:hypothetical protein
MHGTGCWAYMCGQAGEYEDVELNSIWYMPGTANTYGPALKLRGTPSERMDVKHNAFRHLLDYEAIAQTESGLVASDNFFGQPEGGRGSQSCDFDGDGVPDAFRTTGVAWYYRSSLLDGRYAFLTTSAVAANAVTLGPLTDDGRCDARAGTFVHITPSGAPFDTAPPGDQVTTVGRQTTLQLKESSGSDTLFWAAADLPDGLHLDEASGVVSGTPLHAGTYSVMLGADNGQGDTVTRVFSWTVNSDLRPVPSIVGANRSKAAGILSAAGLSLGIERDVARTSCEQIGVVLDQTPIAGSTAPVGSTIAFSFGVKPSGNFRCN